MTHTMYELIPTPADYLQKSLEAFEQVMTIIGISALVLIVTVVAIVILACYNDPKQQQREEPARTTGRDQSGQLIRLADWRSGRIEPRSCGEKPGGVTNGPREDSAAS